jgi:hypothetical protein
LIPDDLGNLACENPPLSASKTKHFIMCNLAAKNKPDLAAKSGFRLSPENLCRERREAKPTPVYPSGEKVTGRGIS